MNAQVMVITRLLKYLQKKHSLQQQILPNFLNNFNMVFIHGRPKEFYGTLLISVIPTPPVTINLKWMLALIIVYLGKVMVKLQAKAAASIRARVLEYRGNAGRHLNILKQQLAILRRILYLTMLIQHGQEPETVKYPLK